MFDHEYLTAVQHGNRGAGITIGLIEATEPGSWHEARMMATRNRVAPDAGMLVGHASESHSVIARLAQAGCSVIAMPLVWDAVTVTGWSEMIGWAAAAGVLLFAGMGDGAAATEYPASHPLVYSCGTSLPAGQAAAGKWDIAWEAGDDKASGACVGAACGAALWLSFGLHVFGNPADRKWGFDAWLKRPSHRRNDRGAAWPFYGDLY